MHTRLQINGANCSRCLNDVVERLRAADGVNSVESSIGDGCIAVDHDELNESDLIAWIGESLHSVGLASNEIVMNSIVPTVSVLPCEHGADHSHVATSGTPPHRLETVTDALARLRAAGYTADFSATDDGQLACLGCERTMDPTEATVHETIRFEGDTNPDDQDIVFALHCVGGCAGTYTAAYGPSAPPNDANVLRQLARNP
jgi:copper chaperone CopZ